jgi:hypothetical protein
MYPSPQGEAQTSVASRAVTLEADIATLIQVAGGSLRSPHDISQSNTEQVHLPPLIAGPNEVGACHPSPAQNSEYTADNCQERRTQGNEIRSYSADRILSAQRIAPSARAIFFKGVLLGSLGTGAIFGLAVHPFDIRISGPTEQREHFSTQALRHKNVASGTLEAARKTASATGAEKVSPFTASNKFESTRNPAQRPPVVRQNTISSSAFSTGGGPTMLPRPISLPETKPTTIEGWMVRDVIGGAAVLEGPGGVWSATRGDIVPGVGTVDSIVRWGNHWIVATSKGLISTP